MTLGQRLSTIEVLITHEHLKRALAIPEIARNTSNCVFAQAILDTFGEVPQFSSGSLVGFRDGRQYSPLSRDQHILRSLIIAFDYGRGGDPKDLLPLKVVLKAETLP